MNEENNELKGRNVVMKLYEKAWFEYGQRFLQWQKKREYFILEAQCYEGALSYSDMRRALPQCRSAAQNAWNARCRAIKLRKEIGND